MSILTNRIKSVERIIKRYGEKVTFKSTNPEIEDETKPWDTSNGKEKIFSLQIIFLSASSTGIPLLLRELMQYSTQDGAIPVGSIRGYMAPQSFEPKLSDYILRNNKELKIKGIDILSPGGEPLLYILEFET